MYVFRPNVLQSRELQFVPGIHYIYRVFCNALGIPALIGINKCPLLSFAQGSHIVERAVSSVDVEYLDVSLVERLRHWCDVGQIFNSDI